MNNFPFPVLAQTRDALIMAKPAGLAVHPGPRTPHSLEEHLPALATGGFVPVAAHRLDRDTSGCLAVALTRRGAKGLAAAFSGGGARKLYWAILSALPAQDDGLIDAPLAKISSAEAGWRMVVRGDGKPARTHWQVIDRARRLVAFRPETGRTHQIRVHATLIGGAIAGDPVYGDGIGPMRLHARALSLDLPDGVLAATAPLPADWPAGIDPESR